MKINIVKSLWALMLIFLTYSSSVRAETYGNLEYEINEDAQAVTITGCSYDISGELYKLLWK